MTHQCRRMASYAWILPAGLLMLVPSAGPTKAGDVSERQIIDSLTQPRTRGLAPPQEADQDHSFIQDLRHRTTRSLTLQERGRVATIVRHSPKIDLEIHFDFDSAAITPVAEPQLASLGRALTSADLKETLILLGGHTDAKGSASYNQDLSERRADAVRTYLVEKFHVSAENLKAIGYGEQNLVNKNDPFAAQNRRVQIVNLASKQEAAR